MKKFLSVFCAFITAISLTACNNFSEPESGSSDDISNNSEFSDSSDTSTSSGTSEPDISGTGDPDYPDDQYDESDPLPHIDGSTSAIPLDAGLRSGFLGIPYVEAKREVYHTTTHESFKRLINGKVDLIFSVPISDEQQQAADDAGVTLIMEPVAKEGFVFVVNAENPVDSLTSEQIRKIYSGEITNWSQVGGEDRAILAYQRTHQSGSQNYMTVFMGDTPLTEPEKEFIAGGMAGIMDAVAVYDNSAGAIGYSVYSYAAQMYANTSSVKFIAVDGVAPSKQTMADESYPLLSRTYLIYTDRSSEKTKKFAKWALSDEGQSCVLEYGYLPVNGMEIPEKYLPYEAVGTGEPRPAGLVPSQTYSTVSISAGTSDGYAIHKTNSGFELRALKNKELQNSINKDILKAFNRIKDNVFETTGFWLNDSVDLMADCRNGYLSIILYTRNKDSYYGSYDQIETLNYDLFSGKKIERFSDLFYEGEDFLPLVNKQLALEISAAGGYYYEQPKLDFCCILGEPTLFTINSIGFEPGNVYFPYANFVAYSRFGEFNESDYLSVTYQYRDMTSLFEDELAKHVYENSCLNEWKTKYVIENGDTYLRFTGSAFHTPEEVEAQDKLWYDLQRRASECIRKTYPNYRAGGELYYGKTANYYYVRYRSPAADDLGPLCFDADTLEIITIDMLVDGDWRQYLGDVMYDDGGKIVNKKTLFAECDTLYPMSLWHNKDTMHVYAFADKELEIRPVISLKIPLENINKKYYEPLTY